MHLVLIKEVEAVAQGTQSNCIQCPGCELVRNWYHEVCAHSCLLEDELARDVVHLVKHAFNGMDPNAGIRT
jgi:hypothetical protein